MSSWGTVKGGCPQCCGDLDWHNFDSDCRGNSGSAGVVCKTNGCKLTKDQVSAFWSDLLAKQQADWDESCKRDRARLLAKGADPKCDLCKGTGEFQSGHNGDYIRCGCKDKVAK